MDNKSFKTKETWPQVLKIFRGSDLAILLAWAGMRPLNWEWTEHYRNPKVNASSLTSTIVCDQAVLLLRDVVNSKASLKSLARRNNEI